MYKWAGIIQLFLREDDITALAGADSGYQGPQNFNCVSVCVCAAWDLSNWRGLETSGLLEDFRLDF